MNDDSEIPDGFDDAPIQIDVYGVKAQIRPVAAYERQPRTWREVLKRVNQHLMTLVEAPFSVPAAAVQGTTNLLRGFGALFTRRVSDAHEAAEDLESEREEKASIGKAELSSTTPSDGAVRVALESLESVLDEFRARGLKVEIRDLGRGRLGFFILPEEFVEVARSQVVDVVLRELQSDGFSVDELRSWDELTEVELQTVGNRPISDLNLSIRVRKLMVRIGLATISELISKSRSDLLQADGFGQAALQEVEGKLADLGLKLWR